MRTDVEPRVQSLLVQKKFMRVCTDAQTVYNTNKGFFQYKPGQKYCSETEVIGLSEKSLDLAQSCDFWGKWPFVLRGGCFCLDLYHVQYF